MTSQRRTPGTTRIEDRWTRRDGTPSARHGQGKRWLLRWIDHNSQEKTASYTRKIDAQNHEKTIIAQFHSGDYIDPNNARTTLGHIHDQWATTTKPTIKPSTHADRESNWNKHVAPDWKDREIGSIRKADIQQWIAEKHDDGTGVSTLETCLQNIRGTLNHAVDAGLLKASPATGIRLPKTTVRAQHILTVAQVEQLARTVNHLPEIVRFLAYTGLRWGEASALTIRDIDPKHHRITVNKAYSDVQGRLILGDTKTYETRTVRYPTALDEHLHPLLQDRPLNELVFRSLELKPIRHSNYGRRTFRPAVKQLHATNPDFPNLTLHDLRHTAASLAISSGATPPAVQRMLGHSNAAFTLRVYTGLFDDDLDSVAMKMDALINSGLKADQTKKDPHPEESE